MDGTRDKLHNELRQAEAAQANSKYVLHLYIAGSSPRSLRAVAKVKGLCGSLQDRCELKIIDIFQQPLLAKADQIIAVPTLVKKLPCPVRLFVGDLSDSDTILACLTS
ncbi:MAG: circadian clock KaiB family protein [Negativicutes bacterium]|nr:circadian clock KaiB family protein [Negativicutes bacterium]MDR3592842.1 circadian clock KaiB family protein [Negativicutes bacterium]